MKACQVLQRKGYQSVLNSLLRSALIEQLRGKAKSAKLRLVSGHDFHSCPSWPSQIAASLQLRVLGFGLLVNRDVGIGVFPEGEEIMIRLARGLLVTHRLWQ